jgi:hypothetical protein
MSTGPKTFYGRARASRNALRHGLTLSVLADPVLSDQVKKLARELACRESGELYQVACQIAEAHIDLNRVRRVRHQIMSRALGDPFFDSDRIQKVGSRITRRYYTSLRHKKLMTLTAMAIRLWDRFGAPESEKEPIAVSELAGQLQAISRFERRARYRRTRAIRAYDALLQTSAEIHPSADLSPSKGSVQKNRHQGDKTKPIS